MHGSIFTEIRKFADDRFGAGGFSSLAADAGLGGKLYLTIEEYPDAEAGALLEAAARKLGRSPGDVLEELGRHLVPGLLSTYGPLLDPKWGALDVIEHTEETVHRVVRLRQRGARPPYLSCERQAPDHLLVFYTSQRKMCRLARGIVKGIAAHKRETITVSEPECMLDGAARCVLSIRRVL